MKRWLSLESQAERLRMAQKRASRGTSHAEKSGDTLLDLAMTDYRNGVGGRYLVSFVKRNRTLSLPWNRLRVGAPVVVSAEEQPEEDWLNGIVSSRNSQSIEVALEDWPEGDRFRIDLSTDEIARQRQTHALQRGETGKGRVSQLREILLGQREPIVDAMKSIDWECTLNASQKEAIEFAFACRDLAIIHGPPGTGKTTTVVELIACAAQKGLKILATAPSNAAVDNLLERLVAKRVRAVRLGHPARVQEDLQEFTLDSLLEHDPAMDVVRDMRKEADQVIRKANKFTRAKPQPGAKQEMRRESRQLRDDARRYEQQLVECIIDNAQVVCATTTFDPEVLGDRLFDVVVIDEACQSTEAGCWPSILRGNKIVLAGDHCQLPPTVLSNECSKEGMSISMMERLVSLYGSKVTRRLDVQYRMHEDIMCYSSRAFYKGTLQADPSVANRKLVDIARVETCPLTDGVVSFIDTAGASFDEEQDADGESKQNPNEGKLVLELCRQLIEFGVAPADIAVISPYAAQVRAIREKAIWPSLEIDTVDGFQGREKEVVLISLVRSNANGEIGFLADTRRMNVAMTRAKRRLIVIGDSATISCHPFYAEWLEFIESIHAYQSVWEFALEA